MVVTTPDQRQTGLSSIWFFKTIWFELKPKYLKVVIRLPLYLFWHLSQLASDTGEENNEVSVVHFAEGRQILMQIKCFDRSIE